MKQTHLTPDEDSGGPFGEARDGTGYEPDLVLVLDPEAIIQDVPYVRRAILGITRDDLMGTSFYTCVHDTELLHVFRCVVDLVVGDLSVVPVYVHLQLKKGNWHSFAGTAAAHDDASAGILSHGHSPAGHVVLKLHLSPNPRPHTGAELRNASAFKHEWTHYVGRL